MILDDLHHIQNGIRLAIDFIAISSLELQIRLFCYSLFEFSRLFEGVLISKARVEILLRFRFYYSIKKTLGSNPKFFMSTLRVRVFKYVKIVFAI